MGLAGNFITHSFLMFMSLRTRISVFDKNYLYPFNEIQKKKKLTRIKKLIIQGCQIKETDGTLEHFLMKSGWHSTMLREPP